MIMKWTIRRQYEGACPWSKNMRDIEEIKHMLMHALTEETLEESMEQAASQLEAYNLMKELPYFDLTIEEFRAGIEALQ